MNTQQLPEDFEKRFDERFGTEGMLSSSNLSEVKEVKQFLAQELELQYEEMFKKSVVAFGMSQLDGKPDVKAFTKQFESLTKE